MKGGVIVEYTLENRGSRATQVAPWEITRLFPRGLSLLSDGWRAVHEPPGLARDRRCGRGDVRPLRREQGREPPEALRRRAGRLPARTSIRAARALIVKVFEDISASQAAPGEGEIEIYFDGQKRYIELEQQGRARSLRPGQVFSWKVGWYLRKIPETLAVAPGSAGARGARSFRGHALKRSRHRDQGTTTPPAGYGRRSGGRRAHVPRELGAKVRGRALPQALPQAPERELRDYRAGRAGAPLRPRLGGGAAPVPGRSRSGRAGAARPLRPGVGRGELGEAR